jgi:MinD superfamily P-loop ATPase
MAAILGLQQRLFSRFRITTWRQCIMRNCSTYCEMGIDVRSYAQKEKYRSFFLCRLRVCSAVCPRGVLKLENDTAGRINSEILLGNDFKLMDLITNK